MTCIVVLVRCHLLRLIFVSEIFYNYKFDFPDGNQKQFHIDFDKTKLQSNVISENHYPDWAQLEFNQCNICPLTSEESLYCPLIVNLVPIIYWCKDLASYDEVNVTVTSLEREVRAQTTLTRAVSSLLGLLMSSSACPKMKFLRPMARFHLPFATHEETLFRSVSASFLSNYFNNNENISDDDVLIELKQQYKELQDLNRFIAERIRYAIKRDAAVNAIVLLDVLSKRVSFSIDDSLQSIRYIFENGEKPDIG